MHFYRLLNTFIRVVITLEHREYQHDDVRDLFVGIYTNSHATRNYKKRGRNHREDAFCYTNKTWINYSVVNKRIVIYVWWIWREYAGASVLEFMRHMKPACTVGDRSSYNLCSNYSIAAVTLRYVLAFYERVLWITHFSVILFIGSFTVKV